MPSLSNRGSRTLTSTIQYSGSCLYGSAGKWKWGGGGGGDGEAKNPVASALQAPQTWLVFAHNLIDISRYSTSFCALFPSYQPPPNHLGIVCKIECFKASGVVSIKMLKYVSKGALLECPPAAGKTPSMMMVLPPVNSTSIHGLQHQ